MESPVTECILVLGLILKEEPGLPKAQGCGAAHSIHYPWWPPGCDDNVYCLKLRSRCCTEPLYPLHTVSLPFLLAGMVEYLHTAGGVIREAVEIGFRRVEIFPPHSESPIVKHLAFVLRPATMPKWVGTISLCKSTISGVLQGSQTLQGSTISFEHLQPECKGELTLTEDRGDSSLLLGRLPDRAAEWHAGPVSVGNSPLWGSGNCLKGDALKTCLNV